MENLKKPEGQKMLERTYGIESDGCINKESAGSNRITLRMDANNTLMVSGLTVHDISIEIMMKAMLMAHTEFLTNYVMPTFASELETRDEGGVIDRISNLPGRGVTRGKSAEEAKHGEIGVAAASAASAAKTVADLTKD